MKKLNKNLTMNIELNPGDLLVVYRGTSKVFSMEENTIAIKGNIKRDKLVNKIFDLVVVKF